MNAFRYGFHSRAFLEFVLAHYVAEDVHELDQEKLTPLLRLRYQDSIADAVADFAKPERLVGCLRDFRNICIKRWRE